VLAVLQLDALGAEVTDRMLAQGGLPTLAALRAEGRLTVLTTPASALEGGTSHTLYSGRRLPDHGLYFTLQWSAAEQRVRPAHAFQWPEFIWERLSRAGRRCLVVDPYQARPPETHDGLCLSGWQYRNRVTNRSWSVPVRARRTLERHFGKPPVIEETFGRSSTQRLLALGEALAASPARAADLVTRTLEHDRFDLVWVNLPAVHLGGHQLWDPFKGADELTPAVRERLGGMLERIYTAGDVALGRILDALPEDADLIIVSPLGMGVETSRADFLPGMLSAILLGRGGGSSDSKDRLSRLRARLPTGLRAALARPLPDRLAADLTARLSLSGTDWSRTKAFALPSNHEGCIRFNLRGREREGILDPAETQELTQRIEEGLMSFADDDGAPAVAGVYPPSDRLGEGQRSALLPDLVVEWSSRPASQLTGVRSSVYGEVRRSAGVGRTGGHNAEAWALLLPRRARLRTPSRPADVIDLAATARALLDPNGDDTGGEALLVA
jgi:predicted AlkP superfamily phosphohydrolase/phosphomutase